MKYVEFKNHIYKRIEKEFGFQKLGKKFFYQAEDEKIIVFELQKSNYSNDAYVHIGIGSNYVLKETTETLYALCPVSVPLKEGVDVYELDNMTFEQIDGELDKFFIEIFPNLLSIKKMKKYYFNQKQKLHPFIQKRWENMLKLK